MGNRKQRARFGDNVAKETLFLFLRRRDRRLRSPHGEWRLIRRVLLALALICLAGSLLGAGNRITAHVVWTQGDRIYIAAPDSVKLAPGTILTFQDKKKPIATGEVMNVYDQTFILAKLTSGSFKKTKHPDRLLVFAEPPRPSGPAKLRIGYPSSKRVTAFFACDSLGIDLPRAGFGAVQSSDHLYQLTRNTDIPDTSSWPDTLIVRFFDDPADEEIALERNEIDAAMFWPGEPSTHIRDKLRWSGEPSGLRQRGIVAGLFMSYHPTIDSVTTAVATRWVATALNNELFRGDLAPCGTSVVDTTATVRDLPIRFDVDPAFPNHDDLQILLDRIWRANKLAKATDLVRITYLDMPLDSLTTPLSISGIDERPVKISAALCLFRIRCPILCSAAARSAVEALGPDNIVNLLRCRARKTP